MSRRLVLTVSTAAALSALYGVYSLSVSPLLESAAELPAANGGAVEISKPPRENIRLAERYLASHPWAADADYQLRTDDAVLYAQTLESFDDQVDGATRTAIRFAPFAIIWWRDGFDDAESREDGQEPITIVSEKAVLTFSNRFEFPSGDAGRVVAGALEGPVHIRGEEGLRIDGRNFYYSEDAMRIWSDNAVEFAYGPHHGNAHGMQIEVVPPENAADREQVRIGGVDSVRLLRDVRMNLVPGDGSSGDAAQAAADDEPSGSDPGPVQVQSAGSFDFVFDTRTATFEEQVHVKRPTAAGQFDRLRCDLLTLVFEPGGSGSKKKKDEPAENAEKNSDSFLGLEDNLAFRRMQAEGKSVTLVSDENDLQAEMTRLTYDERDGQVELIDKNLVRVRHKQSRLGCPRIELNRDEEGRISTVVCDGAGWLKRRDARPDARPLDARWKKHLRKYRDEESGLDVIELKQDAVVSQPAEQMQLAAEFIKLWYRERDETAAGDAASRSSKPGKPESGVGTGQFRPRHVLAQKDVTLQSPEMNGKSKRLELWFKDIGNAAPDRPPRPQRRQGAHRRARRRPQAFASVADPLRASSDADAGQRSPSPFADEEPSGGPDEPAEPIDMTAGLIRVLVLRNAEAGTSRVSQVWTQENVVITQKRDAGKDPLRLEGDRLHLKRQGEKRSILHVYGEPAHVRDRGLHIQGPAIHLDQARNRAWVVGEGLLQLPVKRNLQGASLPEQRMLDVRWKEQMTFDGELARFYGEVRTLLEDSRLHCQEMHVLLTDRISFSDGDKARRMRNAGGEDGPEVYSVLCRDGVEFDSYQYEQQKLVEIRRGRFWEFALNQVTGETEAKGPGRILFWRRGRGRRASLAPAASVRPNGPLESGAPDWEYTRIDFVGRMQGNIRRRTSTFGDRVQIVYGPVERPLAVIDPEHLPENGGWMRCEKLHLTQHEKTAQRPGYIEALAEGNAELEGRTFHAQADTISYDESKDLYVLRSLGNRKATIWRQERPGGEPSAADAQRMEFVPSRNQLKLDQTTGLQGLD